MNQVYQLLRNNRLSGPYTLEELKKQHLSASDLVWAEGKSKAWTAPSGLPELEDTQQTRKRPSVYTSAPSPEKEMSRRKAQKPPRGTGEPAPAPQPLTRSLEQQAEELRARALSYTPVRFYTTSITPPSEAHPVLADEEDKIRLVIHKSEGGFTLSQLVLVGLLTAVAAAGWYGSWVPVRSMPDAVNAVALPARFTEEVLPEVKPQTTTAQVSTPTQEELQPSGLAPVKKRAAATGSKRTTSGERTVPSYAERSSETTAAAVRTEENVTPAPPLAAVAETPVKVVQPSAGEAVEASSRKKTLGQAIKNLFRKKKKGDAAPDEGPAESGN